MVDVVAADADDVAGGGAEEGGGGGHGGGFVGCAGWIVRVW